MNNIPGLTNCLAFTEPGALLQSNGNIDIALGCIHSVPEYGGGPGIQISLLRSTDHGTSLHLTIQCYLVLSLEIC